jgi:hypothetical protein
MFLTEEERKEFDALFGDGPAQPEQQQEPEPAPAPAPPSFSGAEAGAPSTESQIPMYGGAGSFSGYQPEEGSAADLIPRFLARTAQRTGQDLYNILYDAASQFVSPGIDVERRVYGPDGYPTEEVYRTRIREGSETFVTGKDGVRRLEYSQPALFGGKFNPLRSRTYYELQEDGTHVKRTTNAPLPFIGEVPTISTGNELLDTAADVTNDIVEFIGLAVLMRRAAANPSTLAAAAPGQALTRQKVAAVFRKEMVELANVGMAHSIFDAAGNKDAGTLMGMGVNYLTDREFIKNNVNPELLQAFRDVSNIDPADPLATRISKGIANEGLIAIPLGGLVGVGSMFANTARRDAVEFAAPYAQPLISRTQDLLAEALKYERAERIVEHVAKGSASAAAEEVAEQASVKVIDVKTRQQLGVEAKLEEARRIKALQDEQGFEPPEVATQITLEEATALRDEQLQRVQEAAQRSETEVAKISVTQQPGVSDLETARPELRAPIYDQTATLPLDDIDSAPTYLQYKLAGQVGRSGATGSLADATRYNPNLAGTMLVWKDTFGEIDPSRRGQVYTVDGHNRLELAKRLNYQGGINVQFIDALDVSEARTIGAMSNIANGKGTPVDAAKVLRDTGMSVEEMRNIGVAPSGPVARLAIGLRDLPQDLFDKVVAGDITEEIGSAIGAGGLPEQVQRDVFAAARKKKWGVERVREAVAMGGEATVTTEIDTGVLPGLGLEELTSSNFQSLMDVRIHARSQLKAEIRALGAVTDSGKAQSLVSAGNVLDVEQSKSAREAAIYGERIFNQMAGMTGPLNELLQELAGQVTAKKRAATIVRENRERIREVLESYVNKNLIPAQAAAKTQRLQAQQRQVDEQAAEAALPPEFDTDAVIATRRQATETEARRYAEDIVRKGLGLLSEEQKAEAVERIVREQLQHGAIVSNPSPIGGKTIPQVPTAPTPEPVVEEVISYAPPQLPKELQGAAPRAGQTVIKFASDVDKAIYIATSKKASKRRTAYSNWLDSLGIDPELVKGNGILIRERLKAARLFNNPQAPKEFVFDDLGVWREGGQLSGELSINTPEFGRLGEMLSVDELRLLQADRADLLADVSRMAGDFNIKFRDQMSVSMNATQAKAYGVRRGFRTDVAGVYNSAADPANDLLLLAEMSGGRIMDFYKRRQIAFHEAFHRIEKRLFTKKELELLADAMPELRSFALRHADELFISHLKGQLRQGKLADSEVRAMVFQGMADEGTGYMKEIITKKPTWAEPLKKLLDVATRVSNWLQGRGYKTWNDVYEEAAAGGMASRTPREASLDVPGALSAQFAVPDIDPEDAAKQFSAARRRADEAIESGEMTIEEALVNDIRRGISRSGKTQYIESTQERLASGFYALRDKVSENTRDQFTGIQSYIDAEVTQTALQKLRNGGHDEVVAGLESMLKAGGVEAGEHVVNLRALQMYRDATQTAARQYSIEYENAIGNPDTEGPLREALVMAVSDMTRLDRHYARVTRTAGQLLREGQMTTSDEALQMALPTNQPLRLNADEEVVNKVLAEGFSEEAMTDGLMGKGIYMTTDPTTSFDWGNSQIKANLAGDISILDLAAMNKRIGDVLAELDLGRVKKKGKGYALTDEQIKGLQDYATARGFDGIRYTSDYSADVTPADEVVIFDPAVANRVVESSAAVDPNLESTTSIIRESVDTRPLENETPLSELMDEETLAKIRDGVNDEETRKLGRALIGISRAEPSARADFARSISTGRRQHMTGDMFFSAYRSALLMSGETYMKMGFGTAARTLSEPLMQAAGDMAQATVLEIVGKPMQLLDMNVPPLQYKGFGVDGFNPAKTGARLERQAYLSLRRSYLSMFKYKEYFTGVPKAFKMAMLAFKENQAFGRAGRGAANDYEDTFQKAMSLRDMGGGSRIEQEVDFSDPNGNNWVSNLTHYLAQAATYVPRQGGRATSMIDTFFNYVVGPGQNFADNLDTSLVFAETQMGLRGKAAWEWASNDAVEKTKKQFVDVQLENGAVIKDGVITGQAADEILNFVQFSDKLRLERADIMSRTYDRGVKVARAEGLTDPLEVHQRAMDHMNSGNKIAIDAVRTLNIPSRAVDAVHRNVIGRWGLPIMTGPLNILKSGARGLGYGVFVDTWWKDLLSEVPATRSRAIGEMAAGWGIYTFVNTLADEGTMEVTGSNPLNYKRSQFNEIVRTPGFSVRFSLGEHGYTDWINVQAIDSLALAVQLVGRTRQDCYLLTKDQFEEQGCGTVLTLGQLARVLGPEAFTRDVFGGIDEIVTTIQRSLPQEGEDNYKFRQRMTETLSSFFARKVGSGVPAGIRNIKNNATEGLRQRPDISGETSKGMEAILDAFDRMRAQVEVQLPGSDAPAVLDPITGFPVMKAQTPDFDFFDLFEGNPWLQATIEQLSPGAAFRTVPGNDDMPVHKELYELQKHTPKPIVFYTRSNMGVQVDGKVLNLNNFQARGLRLVYQDVHDVTLIGASIKIDGMTLEQKLHNMMFGPGSAEYRSYTARRYGPEGEVKESPRVGMVNAVFKQYREAAVREWLYTTERGQLFLDAHRERLQDEAEQNYLSELKEQNDREVAAASRAVIERDLADAGAAQPGSGRLTQEVGNFIQAVGT